MNEQRPRRQRQPHGCRGENRQGNRRDNGAVGARVFRDPPERHQRLHEDHRQQPAQPFEHPVRPVQKARAAQPQHQRGKGLGNRRHRDQQQRPEQQKRKFPQPIELQQIGRADADHNPQQQPAQIEQKGCPDQPPGQAARLNGQHAPTAAAPAGEPLREAVISAEARRQSGQNNGRDRADGIPMLQKPLRLCREVAENVLPEHEAEPDDQKQQPEPLLVVLEVMPHGALQHLRIKPEKQTCHWPRWTKKPVPERTPVLPARTSLRSSGAGR